LARVTRLSIVTTLYHSAAYLPEFHRRVTAAARAITDDYEIILVNDGSPDDSQRIAVELADRDERVSVVELARNFGHYRAIMTGLAQARGEWVFLIDCDLEEDPALLQPFWDKAHADDADVVYGVQRARKGRLFERLTGALFYSFINRLSTTPVPRNVATVRLMRQAYVRALVRHRDREIFLAGLWALTGFRQQPLEIDKASTSPTTYNLARKVSSFVNAVTSFSTKPLVFVFYVGILISIASAIAGGYLLVRRIFFGEYLVGWPSLIVSIWFIGGVTIFSLGVIGIYLSKIFAETKRRPYTTVRSLRGPLSQRSLVDGELDEER
jgi:putative glycosyltransferase